MTSCPATFAEALTCALIGGVCLPLLLLLAERLMS